MSGISIELSETNAAPLSALILAGKQQSVLLNKVLESHGFAVTMVTHALASLLTGYVLAKLAGKSEVQHAAATAALFTVAMIGASAKPNVMLPPVWMRMVMLLITPPALIAGAYVRGQARMIREERNEVENRSQNTEDRNTLQSPDS